MSVSLDAGRPEDKENAPDAKEDAHDDDDHEDEGSDISDAADAIAAHSLPRARGAVAKLVRMKRPSAAPKALCRCEHSFRLGQIKLVHATSKSYILARGDDGKWPLVVEVHEKKSQNHKEVARLLFEHAVKHPVDKDALVQLRQRFVRKVDLRCSNDEKSMQATKCEKKTAQTQPSTKKGIEDSAHERAKCVTRQLGGLVL